jgi:TonB-linked SusC/RagA family outer membrane protein
VGGSTYNPVAMNEGLYNNVKSDQTTGDLGLNFRITKDLSLKSTFAVDATGYKNNQYTNRESSGDIGYVYIGTGKSFYWQNENYFNYNKQIGDHSISGLLGLSWQKYYSESFTGSNNTYFDDFYGYHNIGVGTAPKPGIGSGDNQFTLNSYFARLNYSFKSKYLLTLTGRYDGSSKFGKNSKYGFFPSGSVAWNLSQEEFIKNISKISNLKLRASYGITGNQEIGSYVTQTFISTANVPLGGKANVGLYPSSFGNADLKWENTSQVDVGIDIGLFNNRISATIDVYRKLTNDMLLDVPLPLSSTTGIVKNNYGSVENMGIELFLSAKIIDKSDFTWTTDFTLSRNKNTIKKLGPTGADIYNPWWIIGEGVGTPSLLKVGQSIGSMLAYNREGLWRTTETEQAARYNQQTGDFKWTDTNNDGKLNTTDMKILGTPFPKVEMDLNNSFTYKSFDFNIEFRSALDFYKSNWWYLNSEAIVTMGGMNAVMDGWTPWHQDGFRQQQRSAYGGWYDNTVARKVDTRWVQNSSFIRGEAMTLGYTLPKSITGKLKIQSLRVYLNAKNFSLYAPECLSLDPEGGGAYGGDNDLIPNMDFYGYPKPSSYSFGVNVVF